MKSHELMRILCCSLLFGFALGVNASAIGDNSDGTKLVTKSSLGAWMLREARLPSLPVIYGKL